MALREDLEKIGNWFFKWRSYLPLLILPFLFIALRKSEYFERRAGDLAEDIWEIFCVIISFLGFAIRCIVAGYAPRGTSGRKTKEQQAEMLNTTGIYSIIRHPLYMGNFIIFLGIALFVQVLWFGILTIVVFWLYYKSIIFAEEEFLRKKFGDVYLRWTTMTPAFLPNFKNWQAPGLSFSIKNALRREYSAFFVIVVAFTFLDIIADLFIEGKLELHLPRIILFVAGSAVYIILIILKKKTKILNVEGR